MESAASFFTPAENTASTSIAECSVDQLDPSGDTRFNQHCDDTEVGAAGSSSLGRAAQPPPSEKSSTLDAKDAKLYKEDQDHALNCPPGHSESARAPSTQLVTGVRKRRLVHFQPPSPTNTGTNDTDEALPPPVPAKPPPAIPPRTYRPPPPLPPRHKNEEVEALPRPTEVQSAANDVPIIPQDPHISFEAQDRKPVFVPNKCPPTTVLLPKEHSLSLTESSKCINCENMKGVVRHMMNSNSVSNVSSSSSGKCFCKASKDVTRRHSK